LALFQSQQEAGRSLRDRICETVRQAVQSGRLAHGERLPATRTLAADLRVSRITAEAAYSQLEAEGYLRRRVGDGTFVNVDVTGGPAIPSRRAAALLPARSLAWSRRGVLIVRGGGCDDPLDTRCFSAGFPDLREFPLEIWKRLTARRLRREGSSLLGYGDPAGEPELREAIARYVAQSRGVRCAMDQVIVLTSSQQALNLIATMLTDVGDTVWIEDPGYGGAQTALAATGAKLRPIPIDGEGIKLPGASSGSVPRLIYVTPSHQYPTGVTLSLARRLALLEYAGRRNAWIIEDDYDSEFQYDARPVPSVQGLDPGEHVLYIGTFSKVLFPALRLAYLILPRPLVSGFVTARTSHDGHSARLSQLVTADFMNEGHFAAHIRRMRQIYHHRRDLLLSEIERRIGSWCRPISAGAGLQVTVRLPRGMEGRLTRAAGRAGVITPGISELCLSGPRLDGWLLGFAAMHDEQIIDGVRRLSTLPGPRRLRDS
jgi:GntR family transcriptional regulator/MocR family aminotransferase